MSRRALGARGEALAAEALEREGWRVLERNWRTRRGELDIVARDGDWLVFVEVRTRRGARLGQPEESVDARKARRLQRLALDYVTRAHWNGPWRIDVVALTLDAAGAPERWRHLRNAVGGP